MATNLYEYYTSKGQTLPSVQDRQGVAGQAGITGYTGTADQNAQLLSYLEGSSNPPTSADGINPTGDVTIPQGNTTFGSTVDATAGMESSKSYLDTAAQIQKDQIAQAEEKAKLRAEENKSFFEKYLGSKTADEAKARATTETGINPTEYFAENKAVLAEVKSLSDQYNSLIEARDTQIAALSGQGRGITEDFLNNQTAQINKNAAPKLNALAAGINAKTAYAKALEGNFEDAQKYIKDAVDSATAIDKDRFDMAYAFKQENDAIFKDLDSKYTKAYDTYLDGVKFQYEQSVKEKEEMGKILLDAARYGINLSSYMSGSYSDMQKAYTSRVSTIAPNVKKTTDATTTLDGFNDILQANIDAGLSPEVAAREAASMAESMGVQIEKEDIATLTGMARKLTAAPQPQAVTPTPMTANKAGSSLGKFVNTNLIQPFNPSNLWQGTKDVSSTVGSFFGGLFGD